VAVLVLTACGGAGVSAGSHPHTAVASSSVSVVGMSASPSASVSVMGSEQAAAVESAAGKAIRDKVKEDGGPIPKEVANVSFHLNLYDNVDVTAHVVSIKAGAPPPNRQGLAWPSSANSVRNLRTSEGSVGRQSEPVQTSRDTIGRHVA